MTINPGDSVRVRGWRGVAFRFYGHPIEQREVWVNIEDDEDRGFYELEESEDADRAVVVMVGDDRKHVVDLDDLSPLADSEFCASCGQIGCGHSNP